MARYIVDIKVKANLRTFIEHDSIEQAIASVKDEVFPNIPDELGDFVFEIIEVLDTEAERSSDDDEY